MRTELDRIGTSATSNRQHGHVGILTCVVLVFWCWRRNTKAGHCPLRLSWWFPHAFSVPLPAWTWRKWTSTFYTQIGFLVLVGLACKNAILIVEFAKAQREAGHPRREATLEACQLRLRAHHHDLVRLRLGVVPLMLSEGAGAEMRRTLGTAVFAGMLGVTLLRNLSYTCVLLCHPVDRQIAVVVNLPPQTIIPELAHAGAAHSSGLHVNGDIHLNGRGGDQADPSTIIVDPMRELEQAILALRNAHDEADRRKRCRFIGQGSARDEGSDALRSCAMR